MKWMTLTAALMICCVSSSADAGLFDCFKRDRGCCGQEPTCCAPEAPTCCAPAPVACAPAAAPSCCAPTPVCAPAAPSCCAPAAPTCCDQGHGCCRNGGGFLSRIFSCNKNRCGDSGCCNQNRGWW